MNLYVWLDYVSIYKLRSDVSIETGKQWICIYIDTLYIAMENDKMHSRHSLMYIYADNMKGYVFA